MGDCFAKNARSDMPTGACFAEERLATTYKAIHTETSASHPLPVATSPRRQTTDKSHTVSHNDQMVSPAKLAATGRTRQCRNRHISPKGNLKSPSQQV